MVDNSKAVRKQILDVVGCIAAVITILAYLLLCINSTWTFIPEGSFVMNVLAVIRTWAPLVVVAIVGFEFFADKHLVFRIIFYVAIAILVIFMFFPATWSQFVGLING